MALLLVLTTIAVLALVLVEFSSNAHTHLQTGANMRDEVRATQLAETALVLTRACLDETAWGPLGGSRAMQNIDPQKMCNIMLGIFTKSRVDLPIGGLSFELPNIKGLGLEKGELEEIELIAEDAFIGLGGLRCNGQMRCPSRVRVALQLRTLLCDPSIAHLFEKEQEDGHRYTREEVVGNIVDWIDADDNRIYIDPLNWGQWSQGTGEGEDSYLRELESPYRSKDAPMESIQELRLIRGINDELYEFLKDRVSVYGSTGKVNINSADTDIIASLLQTYNPLLFQGDYVGCGEEIETLGPGAGNWRERAQRYARIITEVRRMRGDVKIANAFSAVQRFIDVARDPMTQYYNLRLAWSGGNLPMGQQELLMNMFGLTPQEYQIIQQSVQPQQLQQALSVRSQVFRLRARARVGNITRQVFALLRTEGKTVRTLYYREE